MRRQSRQPSPNEAEHVEFMLSDFVPLATEERSDFLTSRYDQVPTGSQSERQSYSSVDLQSVEYSQFSMEDLTTYYRTASGLADTSTETITGKTGICRRDSLMPTCLCTVKPPLKNNANICRKLTHTSIS